MAISVFVMNTVKSEHVDEWTKESLQEFETFVSFMGVHRKQLSMDNC